MRGKEKEPSVLKSAERNRYAYYFECALCLPLSLFCSVQVMLCANVTLKRFEIWKIPFVVRKHIHFPFYMTKKEEKRERERRKEREEGEKERKRNRTMEEKKRKRERHTHREREHVRASQWVFLTIKSE